MISATGRMPIIAAPTREPDDRLLGDRRVAHALGAELVDQAAGHAEDAAAGAPDARCPRRCRKTRGSRAISSRSASLSAAA